MTKKNKLIVGLAVTILLVLLGGASAYSYLYQHRALPRTTVAGVKASGMDVSKLGETLSAKEKNTKVDVTIGDFHGVVPLADLGVAVDVGATAQKALAPSHSFWSRIAGLFTSRNIPAVITLDEQKQADFITSALRDVEKLVVEPSVVWSEDDQKFTVVPGADGYDVDHKAFAEAIDKLAKQLEPGSVKMDPQMSPPHLTEDQAREAAAAGDKIVAVNVDISDPELDLSPTASVKASWLDFPTGVDGFQPPQVNAERVGKWMAEVGESTNVPAEPKIDNVDASGKVVAHSRPGRSGWKVNNVDELTKGLVAALQAGEPFTGVFKHEEVEPGSTTRPMAPGAENLPYPAAEGEKWIDVNLTTTMMTAYEGTTVVQGPIPIVPGKPAMPTVEGTFNVYLKLDKQTMKGTNYDGTPYEVKDVPWILYFDGDYAIHGAPWYREFGWSGPAGTHGCVNAPVPLAKQLYDWADIGTIVVSHH